MLFLMDTHGLFDSDWGLNYNRIVATFTTLISSLQIYNIKEQIAGDVLDTLEVCIFCFQVPKILKLHKICHWLSKKFHACVKNYEQLQVSLGWKNRFNISSLNFVWMHMIFDEIQIWHFLSFTQFFVVLFKTIMSICFYLQIATRST